MDTSRRTLRGVGYEPEARAGLNPEPGTAKFRSIPLDIQAILLILLIYYLPGVKSRWLPLVHYSVFSLDRF